MNYKIFVFLISSSILIGLGMWVIVFNFMNYSQDADTINKDGQLCNGVPCLCNNAGCYTIHEIQGSYIPHFLSSLFLFVPGALIMVFTKWNLLAKYFK